MTRADTLHPGAILALLLALSACGSVTNEAPDAGGGIDIPVLPPDAAPPLAECNPPLPIVAGSAWVAVQWSGGAVAAGECAASKSALNLSLEFSVHAFFLDADETTSACYRRCVEVGACEPPLPLPNPPFDDVPPWDDPSMVSVAVLDLDHARAGAFCAWRNGRLPTAAELARATHGDALTVFPPALHEHWLTCPRSGSKSPECSELHDTVYGWPTPVRSWPLDVGPFGHHDLVASAVELTMTRQPASLEEFEALCTLPLGAPDPRDLGSGKFVGSFPASLLLVGVDDGGSLPWLVGGSDQGDGTVRGGVRCAYDPLP